MAELKRWLASLQLEDYHDLLHEHRVDLDVLPELSETDLAELGIPLGDRKRLMRGVAALPRPEPRPAEGASGAAQAEDGGRPDRSVPHDEADEELRQLTLLFADMVGSTHLSNTLDIETYRDAIRNYHLCCSDVVRSHHGFVAQFLGDGVVAYFGYPSAEEDDAERAVAAGLELTTGVARLELPGAVPLEARVGIATGDVLVSALVGEGIAKGTVLGDTPNLAARLQSFARPGQVVVSDATRHLLGVQFDCVSLGRHAVKGFDEPQEIWQVRGVEAQVSRFSARARGPLTPFVGREDERETLRNRWKAAVRGEGQVVLIAGEAGIGKSRCGEWLESEAAHEPHFRLNYQCSPYHSDSALYPVIMQIAGAAALAEVDDDDEKLDRIERLLSQGASDPEEVTPLFARLLSIPCEHRYGTVEGSAEAIRERTVAALLEQVLGLARSRPVMIFFEDLHWIDPSTEELLDALIERIEDHRILLLCTFRPGYEAPWIGRAGVTHLSLSRLDRKRSVEMVMQIAADAGELPEDLLELIFDRTEGVPLFLEELTRTVIEQGRLADGGLAAGVPLPASLKDLLRAKLDSLSSARDIVPLCAAIGRSFPYQLLLAVSGLGEKALRPVLDQLVHAQILLQRGQYPNAAFTFRHALIQEAAYDTLPGSRARALHARIAAVLLEDFSETFELRSEVVAQHFTRAGLAREAREQWRRAAEVAIARSANVEAVRHLEAALAENAKLESSSETVEAEIAIRRRLSVPLEARYWGSGDITRNLEHLRELLSGRSSESDLFLVLHGLCGEYMIAGDAARALALAEDLRPIAERAGGEGALAVLSEHNLGMALFLLGRFDEAVGHFDRSIELSTTASFDEVQKYYVADPRVVDLTMRAWALSLSGDARAGRAAAAEALEAAEACEHDFTRTYALAVQACVQQALSDAPAALEAAERSLEISRRMTFRYWQAWARIMRGWALAVSADPAEGAKELATGLASYAETGSRQIIPYAKTLLAEARLRAGDLADALSLIEEVEAVAADGSAARFHEGLAARVARGIREAAAAQG